MPRKAQTVVLEAIVRNGNTKLGKGIGKVALPAVQTCPGRGGCEKVCYAVRLMRIYPSYDQMVQTHLQILENDCDGYFAQVAYDIGINGFGTVRIHESGDFFSVAQIEGWAATAKAFPKTAFFAYTRSWNQADLVGALEALRALPNVQLFASIESGESAPIGWRTATIANRHAKSAAKGATLCLEAVGIKQSCADCRFCIDAPKNNTRNVEFPQH